MHNFREVTKDLYYVGADEHRLSLFENIHPLTKGVSYNSYLLMDEKTVLIDTVDWAVCRQYLENVEAVLNRRDLDYILINHMEPDHCASLEEILLRYPKAKIISSEKAFLIMYQFGFGVDGKTIQVAEGDTMSFGKHTFAFVAAPMVHWPETLVTLDVSNGVLFSADAFGSFNALDGRLFADEVDFDRDWLDEARRYYTNIVGKYGAHVQALLGKASAHDIKMFCPLHGPIWRKDLGYILDKYDKWSSYEPEEKGVLIAYSSMYGNTEAAANKLAALLVQRGMTKVSLKDVSSTDTSWLISETFKYSHLVLASVTYNLGIYPKMHNFIMDMKALNLQKRTVALIENGSWAPKSGSLMREALNDMKQMDIINEELTIISALNETKEIELEAVADGIIDSMNE